MRQLLIKANKTVEVEGGKFIFRVNSLVLPDLIVNSNRIQFLNFPLTVEPIVGSLDGDIKFSLSDTAIDAGVILIGAYFDKLNENVRAVVTAASDVARFKEGQILLKGEFTDVIKTKAVGEIAVAKLKEVKKRKKK